MEIKPEIFFTWAASNSNIDVKPEPQLQSGMKLKSDAEAGYFNFNPPPRISTFSGDKKCDVSYDLWKYEIICLMKESKNEVSILQAVRRSVQVKQWM